MCSKCALFASDEAGASMCEAFPEGIPVEILKDGFDHRQEFPGDGGVRFTPIGNVDQEWLDRVAGAV
jgi:hypothetical protein